jgi:hypothetical protein
MSGNFAYITQGKLFYVEGDKAREIESAFGLEMQDRMQRMAQSRAWKLSDSFGGMMGGRQLWNVNPDMEMQHPVAITTMARGKEALYYFLESRGVGAFCRYDLAEKEERRIFHREHFHGQDLSHHPEEDLIAFAQRNRDQTLKIVVMTTEARDIHEVTEGDGMDMAPSWIPGSKTRLVFQSAGVARNAEGWIVGLAPFALMTLDTESGQLEEVLEDPERDLLSPRYDLEGNLYFIRRPYEGLGRRGIDIVTLLKDIVLFPFRLLRAIFGFLNAFSMLFSQKPLISAGGPKGPEMNPRNIQIWGKWIDLQKVTRDYKNGEPPALVPASWELVKRAPDGAQTVLAKSVAAFDITPQGKLVYTNGRKARWIGKEGKETSVAHTSVMERVLAVE